MSPALIVGALFWTLTTTHAQNDRESPAKGRRCTNSTLTGAYAFALEGVGRGLFPAVTGRADGWQLSRLPGDPDRDTAPFPVYEGRTDGVVRLRRWHPDDAADVARACDDHETAAGCRCRCRTG